MNPETSAPLTVEARLDGAAPVRIGDVVTVEVVARGDGAATARLVVPRDLGEFEVVGAPERIERSVAAESAETLYRVRLRTFATGRLDVPPLGVEAVGGASRVETRSLAVDVVALTDSRSEPAHAKLVMPAVSDAALLPAALTAALVGAVLVNVWRRSDGTRSTSDTNGSAASTSAALDEIDALVEATRNEEDLVAAYDRLSELVVGFVARTYVMTSRARTSTEIVRAVRARYGGERAGEVAALLDPCDTAKFARGARDVADFRRHAAAVRDFVRRREGD